MIGMPGRANRRILQLIILMACWPVIILASPGCGDSGEVSDAAETVSAQTLTSATTVTVTPTINPQTANTIASIEQEVSGLRGLPIKADIAVYCLNRGELRLEMKKEIEQEYQAATMAYQEKILVDLGLLDPFDNLSGEIEKMLGNEVVGFYDQETKQLKLVNDKPELDLLNQVTLAHEVTHALQDQNFPLPVVIPENSGNDDRDLARLVLVEGDATLAEAQFTEANFNGMDLMTLLLGSLGAWGPSSSNAFLEDSLTFPYQKGLGFVTILFDKGGWPAVDAAYSAPPQSSEQVIHPEKYIAGEAPLPVPAPDEAILDSFGWTKRYENVLGEFGLAEMLGVDLRLRRAENAAAGWGGDSIRYYDNSDGKSLLIMETRWDSFADATEFASAMSDELVANKGVKFDQTWPTAPILRTADGCWLLAQRGDRVLVVKAPDQDAADGAMRASL